MTARASQETPLFTSAGAKLTQAGVYTGFSLRSTGAAVACVRVRDTDVNGAVLDVIAILTNDSKQAEYVNGRVFATALFVEVVAGAVEGILTFRDQ